MNQPITLFGPDRCVLGLDLASIDDYERETAFAPPADPFLWVEPDDATIARLVYAVPQERFGFGEKWETQ